MKAGLANAGGTERSPLPLQPNGGTAGCFMAGGAGVTTAEFTAGFWTFAREGHVMGSDAFAKAFILLPPESLCSGHRRLYL